MSAGTVTAEAAVMRLRTQRARRKGRACSLAPALANAVATAHAAYRLCAKKTQDPNVAVASANAASSLARSFELRTLRLGDRLRLEWLAAMRDPDARLLGECARVLGEAISNAHENENENEKDQQEGPVSDRLRLASAEAYSLMQAVSRTHASPSGAAWPSSAQSVAFLSFAR